MYKEKFEKDLQNVSFNSAFPLLLAKQSGQLVCFENDQLYLKVNQ